MMTSKGPAFSRKARSVSPNGAIRRETSEGRLPGSTRRTGRPDLKPKPGTESLSVQSVDPGGPLNQGMANIGTGWAAQTRMRRRLKRQESEKMIDIGPHLAGAPRPPSPDAWAHIVDDGDRGAALADAFCDWMRELGAVDDDDRVGVEGQRRIDGAIDAPDELRQAGKNCGRPHDRDIGERKNRAKPGHFHVLTADARECEGVRASFRLQRLNQLAAEHVAGMFPSHNEDAFCLRHPSPVFPRSDFAYGLSSRPSEARAGMTRRRSVGVSSEVHYPSITSGDEAP